MASAKVGTLLIRTLAKPISNQIKVQAKQHETFRSFCVSLAQKMYKFEIRLRTGLLGEPAKHVRPLSESKAIENGANALAEGFLFSVAAALIIAETWRSSRSNSKRRDAVDDQLDELQTKLQDLSGRVDQFVLTSDARWEEERKRNDDLERILERVVEIGLRGGWEQLQDTPLAVPNIPLTRPRSSSTSTLSDNSSSSSKSDPS